MSVAYRKKIASSEQRFWNALKECDAVIGFEIVMQRKLFDSAGMKKGSGIANLYSRLGWMHSDFALINAKTRETVLSIELDGKSHESPKQKETDELKDLFLNSAGIPVVRFKVKSSYDVEETNSAILAGLAEGVQRANGTLKNPTEEDFQKFITASKTPAPKKHDPDIGDKIVGLSAEELEAKAPKPETKEPQAKEPKVEPGQATQPQQRKVTIAQNQFPNPHAFRNQLSNHSAMNFESDESYYRNPEPTYYDRPSTFRRNVLLLLLVGGVAFYHLSPFDSTHLKAFEKAKFWQREEPETNVTKNAELDAIRKRLNALTRN